MNRPSTPVKTTVKDDSIIKTHPSFGLLSFSRVSGSSGKLFGSEIETNSYIQLTLTEAEEQWHLHEKHHYGSKVLLQLDITNSQFAELITTMNRGMGIPSTIRFMKGDGHLPSCIDEDTLRDQIQADLKADVGGIVETADKLAADLDKLLNESGISKAKQAVLRDSLNKLRRDLTANLPFVLDQYVEAIEKVTTNAKTEIDATITHAATQLGFKTMKDMAKVLALTEGDAKS